MVIKLLDYIEVGQILPESKELSKLKKLKTTLALYLVEKYLTTLILELQAKLNNLL